MLEKEVVEAYGKEIHGPGEVAIVCEVFEYLFDEVIYIGDQSCK